MKSKNWFWKAVVLICFSSFVVCFTSCNKECICRHNYQNQVWYESLGEMPWYSCGDYEYNIMNEVSANHSIKCSGTKYNWKMQINRLIKKIIVL